MVFSSMEFVCVFLPVVFLLYLLMPGLRAKNALLIVASLLFYAYGEPIYVLLMIASAAINYIGAILVQGKRKGFLFLTVVLNLGILCVFKYTGFILDTVNRVAGLDIPIPAIVLPIGISFFTFQALSYVIDVYRGEVDVQKNFFRVLLYIAFFPQLIAGPIVKYRDIAERLNDRHTTVIGVASGLRRFILGLSKKVLIANTMAQAADLVFGSPMADLNLVTAWIGAVSYMMQIYFDFSGYSDMAIGLGQMFGFRFQENFRHPYGARSIKDFWRRWHISLSSWFRDYVYIPLGGNRKGKVRTCLNKIIVFFLTGLWHGASWTFVVWGLYHGFFLLLEEFIPALRKLPAVLGRIYSCLVVCIGFVIFRADTLSEAWAVISGMFGRTGLAVTDLSLAMPILTPWFIFMLILAILFCAPLPALGRAICGDDGNDEVRRPVLGGLGGLILYIISMVLLIWCMMRLAGSSYNPFIYFRF